MAASIEIKRKADERLRRIYAVLFIVLAVAIAVAGLWLAFAADASDGDVEARREIGGALISGAVLAFLVTGYQELLDRAREKTQDHRDEENALRAVRRELDLRLFTLVAGDILNSRDWAASYATARASAVERNVVLRNVVDYGMRTSCLDALKRGQALAGMLDVEYFDLLGDYRVFLQELPLSSKPAHLQKEPKEEREAFWRAQVQRDNELWGAILKKSIAYQREHYPTSLADGAEFVRRKAERDSQT